MRIFFDKDKKILFITPYKCASTFIESVAERNNLIDLTLQTTGISLDDISSDKNVTIYVTYREPLGRFKSGLKMVQHFYKKDTTRSLSEFEIGCRTLFNVFKYTSFFDKSNLQPYHLFDSHTMHWMMLIPILYVLDANVKPINIKNISAEIKKHYDNVDDLIDKWQEGLKDSDTLFTIFQEVLKETTKKEYITFDEWMAPEIEIFNYLNDNKLNKLSAIKLINNIYSNHRHYFQTSNLNSYTKRFLVRLFPPTMYQSVLSRDIDLFLFNQHSLEFLR